MLVYVDEDAVCSFGRLDFPLLAHLSTRQNVPASPANKPQSQSWTGPEKREQIPSVINWIGSITDRRQRADDQRQKSQYAASPIQDVAQPRGH